MTHAIRSTSTPTLDIAYIEAGPVDGPPVVLSHGFPYDVHTYAEVWPVLAEAGCRVIVPWLRGYGGTAFRDPATPRSGEQAALAQDLIDLIGALSLDRPVVAGYDWGGRASCLTAALRPDLVAGLVTGGGYNVITQMDPDKLLPPAFEHGMWYNRALHHPDAARWLTEHRDAFARHIWSIWSPEWHFDDAEFARSASSFANPDFDAVVIHSYRHRWGLAEGDPALAELAERCAARPPIAVPTVIVQGISGPFGYAFSAGANEFTHAHVDRRELPGIGHNIPQEAPAAFADAVLSLVKLR